MSGRYRTRLGWWLCRRGAHAWEGFWDPWPTLHARCKRCRKVDFA